MRLALYLAGKTKLTDEAVFTVICGRPKEKNPHGITWGFKRNLRFWQLLIVAKDLRDPGKYQSRNDEHHMNDDLIFQRLKFFGRSC